MEHGLSKRNESDAIVIYDALWTLLFSNAPSESFFSATLALDRRYQKIEDADDHRLRFLERIFRIVLCWPLELNVDTMIDHDYT